MSSTSATILPDPQHLRLLGLVSDDRGIVATVAAIAVTSVCPQCGHPSRRIHSHYVRHVADLPWQGIAFRLELHMHRFFCDRLECSQRIFTERLPGTLAPSARTTLRLATSPPGGRLGLGRSSGQASVGEVWGSRACATGSAGVSRDTLLRVIRRMPAADPARHSPSWASTISPCAGAIRAAPLWSISSATTWWICSTTPAPRQPLPGCAPTRRSRSSVAIAERATPRRPALPLRRPSTLPTGGICGTT